VPFEVKGGREKERPLGQQKSGSEGGSSMKKKRTGTGCKHLVTGKRGKFQEVSEEPSEMREVTKI